MANQPTVKMCDEFLEMYPIGTELTFRALGDAFYALGLMPDLPPSEAAQKEQTDAWHGWNQRVNKTRYKFNKVSQSIHILNEDRDPSDSFSIESCGKGMVRVETVAQSLIDQRHLAKITSHSETMRKQMQARRERIDTGALTAVEVRRVRATYDAVDETCELMSHMLGYYTKRLARELKDAEESDRFLEEKLRLARDPE